MAPGYQAPPCHTHCRRELAACGGNLLVARTPLDCFDRARRLRFASCQGGHEERMKSMSDALRSLRTPAPSVPHRRMALASSLRRMRSSNLRGDYFEFGLYRGSSFSAAQTLSRRYGLASEMRFFGFDSFQGLPEPAGIDVSGEFRRGDYACSRAKVTATLDKRGADWERIHLVEGWYEQSLTERLKSTLAPGRVGIPSSIVTCTRRPSWSCAS